MLNVQNLQMNVPNLLMNVHNSLLMSLIYCWMSLVYCWMFLIYCWLFLIYCCIFLVIVECKKHNTCNTNKFTERIQLVLYIFMIWVVRFLYAVLYNNCCSHSINFLSVFQFYLTFCLFLGAELLYESLCL